MATALSCENCPSYLTPSQAATHFGKSVGAPVCARWGWVYGKIGLPARGTQKLQEHYASQCNEFGNSRPAKKDVNVFPIAIGQMASGFTGVPPVIAKPPACSACKFYAPEDVVMSELSWTTSLCKKKGELILSTELRAAAEVCNEGEVGLIDRSTNGITLFPELMESFGAVDASALGNLLLGDPKDFDSDKELSDLDKASGIVAWRLIENPDPDFHLTPGEEVYLPIFNESIFDEAAQAKIPRTDDKEHPEEFVDYFGGVYAASVHLTKLNMAPGVWGIPGVGKTELFRHLAWMCGMPLERFTITGSSELDDLAGRPHFDPKIGTYFSYGRFVRAYQTICWLLVDEWNLGPKDVQQFFRPLIDNSKQMVMDVNVGETLMPTDYTFLGFAMNPAWDIRNVGTEALADADTNRLMHIEIPMPEEGIELAIVQRHLSHDGWQLNDAQQKMVTDTAAVIRGLIEAGPLASLTWGLRPQIKVARALRYFSPMEAYRQAVANNLDPVTREALLTAVRGNVI